MANLKEVRIRITSVSSTQQITKAMKMVSAAKLRRAQDAITQMRPYARKLQDMLSNIISSLELLGSGERVTKPYFAVNHNVATEVTDVKNNFYPKTAADSLCYAGTLACDDRNIQFTKYFRSAL